jgi:hypothetical protein
VTSDCRTKFIWIKYILLLLWHLLASLLHPLSVPQNYIVLFHRMIPDPWLGHCTDCWVCVFILHEYSQ